MSLREYLSNAGEDTAAAKQRRRSRRAPLARKANLNDKYVEVTYSEQFQELC